MAQICISAESSDRASLEEARAIFNRLLAELPQASEDLASGPEAVTVVDPDAEEPDEGDLAQRFIEDLWKRTGDGLHQLLSVMASFDGWFTLTDIAEETGETLSKTHSRFASLGRSHKAARNNVPGAPELLTDDKQPGGHWRFSMPKSLRNAIRLVEDQAE